jgi:FG-GAP-like repeat/ASPIC and UnbV
MRRLLSLAATACTLAIPLVAGALLEAQPPPAPESAASASTREMAELLRERAAAIDPMAVPFVVSDRRADVINWQLARPLAVDTRLTLRVMAAVELVNAGRLEDGLKALEALESDAKQNQPDYWRQHEASARMLQVAAYMRMAEDQNCHRSSRDACLLPIRGGGIHVHREGSTRASQLLELQLRERPDDLAARWLLNIAHMTLGSYPAGVPEPYRIPPTVFASEYPLPRFDNVAREVGLEIFGLAGGGILEDFDNDGDLDVMTSSQGLLDQMRYFRNEGNGRFEERTREAGLAGEVGGLNMVHADYDNDGFADVLVLRGGWLGSGGRFPLSLIRNGGDGTFSDVTKAAGLLRFAPTQTAAWLDYDGDGRLDLFVGNESTPGDEHPCQLFHNDGDGTFSERARDAGVAFVGFVKGVVSGDYDNDGRPDLYLSVMGAANRLYRNDGPEPRGGGGRGWRFTEVAGRAGVTEPLASFPALFFDYDDDGWLDLFVGGYGRSGGGSPLPHVVADYLGLPTDAERGRLYRNRGDGTFEDVTRFARLYKVVLAMGLNFGDLDNDGWLDFYAGTGTPELTMLVPKRMFRNDGKGAFQDVTTAGNFGHLQKGHGIAFGDVDNDGDQDVFEQMGGAFPADKAWSVLYENPGNDNAWLVLELQGVRSNRRALGARIKLALATETGRRFLYRTVGSGGSFGGSPFRQEIGLGRATRVEWVEVTWPATGELQRIEGLLARRHYRIREGAREAEELKRPAFVLARTATGRADRKGKP